MSTFLDHISQLSGFQITQQDILRPERGKPEFKPPFDTWHFNLSHSANCFAYCFSRQKVGIDIELINHKRNIKGIADSCFGRNESALINNSGSRMHDMFYTLWTRKEACIKAQGLSIFNIKSIPEQVCPQASKAKSWLWSPWGQSSTEKYSLSVYAPGSEGPLELSMNSSTPDLITEDCLRPMPHDLRDLKIRP